MGLPNKRKYYVLILDNNEKVNQSKYNMISNANMVFRQQDNGFSIIKDKSGLFDLERIYTREELVKKYKFLDFVLVKG